MPESLCPPRALLLTPAAALLSILVGCAGGGGSNDGGTDGGTSAARRDSGTRTVDGGLAYRPADAGSFRGYDAGTGGPVDAGTRPPTEGALCTETCRYSNDGDCDDGGEGSDYSGCDFGTDCLDCGPRDSSVCVCGTRTCGKDPCGNDCGTCAEDMTCAPATNTCVSRSSGMCEDTCTYASDGACDDGGPDSSYSVCELGTDCADCGPR